MNKSNKRTLCVIFVPLMVISACKPTAKTASSTKTLDNLAAGDQRVENECRGIYASDRHDSMIDLSEIDPSRHALVTKWVKTSLSAVPSGLQETYFQELRGKIKVTPRASEVCAEFAKGTISEASQACPQRNNGSFVLVVEDDKRAIEHNAIKIFAYLLNGLADGSGNNVSKTTGALGAYIKLLQLNLVEHFEKDLGADPKYSETLKKFQQAKDESSKKIIREQIFANAFDSIYCSDQTRENLKQFPNTYTALQNLLTTSVKLSSVDGSIPEALYSWKALTGAASPLPAPSDSATTVASKSSEPGFSLEQGSFGTPKYSWGGLGSTVVARKFPHEGREYSAAIGPRGIDTVTNTGFSRPSTKEMAAATKRYADETGRTAVFWNHDTGRTAMYVPNLGGNTMGPDWYKKRPIYER